MTDLWQPVKSQCALQVFVNGSGCSLRYQLQVACLPDKEEARVQAGPSQTVSHLTNEEIVNAAMPVFEPSLAMLNRCLLFPWCFVGCSNVCTQGLQGPALTIFMQLCRHVSLQHVKCPPEIFTSKCYLGT